MRFSSFTYLFIFVAAVLTPVIQFLEYFVFNDWEFLGFMVILIVIDTILGFWRGLKDKCISSKGFGMIFRKLFVYMSLLILSHVLVNFTIEGEQSIIFLWFDDLVYSAILLRESISILENVAIIYPNTISIKILEKLKDFDLNGKVKSPSDDC